MADELTLGEVARRLADVHTDLKDDLNQLMHRLDSKVSTDIFELRMKSMERDITSILSDITQIEDAHKREKEQQDERQRLADERRRMDRRLAFSALVAPVILLLLQVWLSTQGAKA